MLLTFAPRRTCPSGQDHRHTSSGDGGGIQSKLDPFLFLELSMSLGTNTCHCVLFCGDVIGTRTLLKPGQAHPDIRSLVCVCQGLGDGGGVEVEVHWNLEVRHLKISHFMSAPVCIMWFQKVNFWAGEMAHWVFPGKSDNEFGPQNPMWLEGENQLPQTAL